MCCTKIHKLHNDENRIKTEKKTYNNKWIVNYAMRNIRPRTQVQICCDILNREAACFIDFESICINLHNLWMFTILCKSFEAPTKPYQIKQTESKSAVPIEK